MIRFGLRAVMTIAALLAALPAATQQSVPPEAVAAARVQNAGIAQLVAQLGAALHRGDAGMLADLFTDDADFTNVIDQSVRGRENIYRHHVPVFANRPPTRSVNILSHRARMITPTVAALEVRWNNKHSPEPDGSRRPDRHGVWVGIAIRQADGWRFAVVRNVMLDDGTRLPKPPAR
jgi:uncharacterized protein (TIGR02246 family)